MNSRYARWFGFSVGIGLLFDLLVGLPAIFAPAWAAQLLHEPIGSSLPWIAFTSLLLVLLSFFYIPVALEPQRLPALGALAVFSRIAQTIFFTFMSPTSFLVRFIANLTLTLLQIPLFLCTRWNVPRPAFDRYPIDNSLTADDIRGYTGSSFKEVRDIVFRDGYTQLPIYANLGLGDIVRFFNASARNLADRRDIRPYFDKLIHSHGICFTGTWQIDQASAYTGYFSKGSKGLLIARFSVAGPMLRRGSKRALGIAGKIYPGNDPELRTRPANFVTVSHLSGNFNRHIIDIVPTNAPTIGFNPVVNLVNRVLFRLIDTRPGYRQLHPISTLGVPPADKVVTPDLMRLIANKATPRMREADFRDELRLKNYPNGKLCYDIEVKNFADERWTRLGFIELTEDVISEGGDKRLHFWVPADVPARN